MSNFPNIDKYERLSLDFETDGIDRHGLSKPVSAAICTWPGFKTHFFSWGHPLGNNCTQVQFRDWAQIALRSKTISFVNPSFDLHMADKTGVNLEAIGVVPRCVQYKAALLNELRRDNTLNGLANEYLGIAKVDLDPKTIYTLPAQLVEEYTKKDALLTMMLDVKFELLLAKEGLLKVAKLEDDLIYSTAYMERQGARLNIPKLKRWRKELIIAIDSLKKDVNVNVNSRKQLEQWFKHMGASNFGRTPSGDPSFSEDNLLLMRSLEGSKIAKAVDEVLKLRATISILDKYVDKYLKEVGPDGVLHYNLHQCRNDENGTITGRYSASSVNIQQVSAEEKQDECTRTWIIREAFLPAKGFQWGSADASQIEFRLFAHYSNSTRLIRAYVENPNTDFHQEVSDMTGIIRKFAKNINFCKIYGGGPAKVAAMMRCSMDKALEFVGEYERRFPEAGTLMNQAMRIARRRKYVKTLLGRRRRFPRGERLHSALNAVIQGSAADIMKKKILEVYNRRKELGFDPRFTVHDELDGDVEKGWDSSRLKKVLDEPAFDLKVPIPWEIKVGKNWRLK